MGGQYNRNAPCSNGVAYTDCASANKTFPAVSQRLIIGSAGNLQLTMEGGQDVTIVGLVAGSVLEVAATASTAAGTTVTNLAVLW